VNKIARSIGAERFKSLFEYNLFKGKLYWKNVSKYHLNRNGLEAGFPRRDSNKPDKYYWIVKIDRHPIKRATIIYALATSIIPDLIDHKDGNSLNDSIHNLREATHEQNSWNRKIGKPGRDLPMGIRLIKSSGRYQARITHRNKLIPLGTFSTVNDAQNAYLEKRKELFGEFA